MTFRGREIVLSVQCRVFHVDVFSLTPRLRQVTSHGPFRILRPDGLDPRLPFCVHRVRLFLPFSNGPSSPYTCRTVQIPLFLVISSFTNSMSNYYVLYPPPVPTPHSDVSFRPDQVLFETRRVILSTSKGPRLPLGHSHSCVL